MNVSLPSIVTHILSLAFFHKALFALLTSLEYFFYLPMEERLVLFIRDNSEYITLHVFFFSMICM